MRFENKHFLIIIEKKKKETAELYPDKEKGARKKRFFPVAGGVLVAAAVIIIGVFAFSNMREKDIVAVTEEIPTEESYQEQETNEERENEEQQEEQLAEGTYVTSTRLASAVREKYKDETPYGYVYGEPIKGVKRGDSIELEVGFDPVTLGMENWTELVALYEDPELTYPITPYWSYDEERQMIVLDPVNYPIGRISTLGLSTEQVTKYPHNEFLLFARDAGMDWGNLGTMYMAIYKDLDTGEDLEKPIVRIVSLTGEIEETPVIRFSVSDDGRATLQWDPVEGAEEYFVCKIDDLTKYGMDGNALTVAVTEGTSWIYASPEFDSYSNTNSDFKFFDMSEDDWYDDWRSENAREKYGITEGVYKDTSYKRDEVLCVIAVNKEGTSMISNRISVSEMAANLPYRVAYDTSRASGFSGAGYDSIDEVSAYGYVTMCDGHTATKLIDYQTENAKISTEHLIEVDEEGNYIRGVDVPVLKIPYIIEGTPFEYVTEIQDYDEVNLEKDLAFLDEREDKLRKKSGDITITNDIEMDEEAENASREELAELQVREIEEVPVTANCALSEYLAMNMLGGATLIDLSDFPEASDPDFVDDAWREAYYQNPLILGVKGYKLNKKGTAMRVIYDEDAVSTAAKQQEILQVLPEIIASIITPDMTDLEKELAINQYLCDNIEYDEGALENARKNNFEYVDDEFIDSFTAYGALLNGKCVCAGYASAFKLLAEEAGMNAVVVTGILEGSLSHAWNKVMIDGEWQILDVTNNDNEYLFNALLNLPDYAGDRVLVEDRDYVIDTALKKYDSTQENNEYYRINERYFPYEEITAQLAAELDENGETVLRTEYELNDEMFYTITDGIFEQLGEDIDLYGFYWMGVIYLSLSE